MPGASLRNLVKRPVHKERHQLSSRKKYALSPSISFIMCFRLGLLEKHSDYTKRAKRYHKKKNFVNSLKEKAYLRNPEEFHYSMIRGKVNAKGQVVLPTKSTKRPFAKTEKPDYDAKRSRIRVPSTDSRSKVVKFAAERHK